MSTTSPTLSYVSSVDVTSASNQGLIKFQILFDASLVTLGNLIMFEYKFQTFGQSVPNLDNTTFGFISVEDAIQSGIQNQYVIAVPAPANTYDVIADDTIQVRVYFGIIDTSHNVLVTPWSNALNVYNPPVQPVIYTDSSLNFSGAYYDPTYDTDNLYVLLDPVDNPYNYDTMKFVVCYFYQDASGETVWSVSDPLPAEITTFGTEEFRLITVEDIGTVSTDLSYNKVYVSIHAVYDWVDGSDNNYYAVSYMSNEVVAVQASSDNNPDITDVSYNVYNTNPLSVPGNQTMTVTWSPPGNSTLPPYVVTSYSLYYSLNGDPSYTEYQSGIPGNATSWTVNVGSTGLPIPQLNLDCGVSIVYRVVSITVSGGVGESDPSVSINIFKYAEAVTDLVVTDTTYDPSSQEVGLTVNFNGVSDSGSPNKGCGNGLQYVVMINDTLYSDASGVTSYAYDPSGGSYSIVYSGLQISQVGTVKVYLQTTNTNAYPSSPLNGMTATTTYIANDVTLTFVDYNVYTLGNASVGQLMNLSWTNAAVSPWTVQYYEVQYLIDGSGNWETDASTNSTVYSFDAEEYSNPPVRNIAFRIVAYLTDGDVEYSIISNTVSENTFKWAEQVTNALTNWAATDPSETFMDIQIQYQNPTMLGTNNGVQFIRSIVYDDSGNQIVSPQSQVDTSFNGGLSTPYIINFNDLPYSANGTVVISVYVLDTNGGGAISFVGGYDVTIPYVTTSIPVFQNIDSSSGLITGNIVTNNILKPSAAVTYIDGSGQLITRSFIGDANGNIDGVTLNFVIQPNGVFYYTFIVQLSVFFPPGEYRPSSCTLYCANNAGVSVNGFVPQINY
jgi:hypothetical protein